MKGKLNGKFRVKWNSDVYYHKRDSSIFTYSMLGPLMHRFTYICKQIVDCIALRGHVATVEQMAVDNGVVIMERWPNDLTIIEMHWVWIEKED